MVESAHLSSFFKFYAKFLGRLRGVLHLHWLWGLRVFAVAWVNELQNLPPLARIQHLIKDGFQTLLTLFRSLYHSITLWLFIQIIVASLLDNIITFVIRSRRRKISVLKMAKLGDLWLRGGGWCNPAFNLLRRCLSIACVAVSFWGMKFSQGSSFATQDSSLSYDCLLVLFHRQLLSLLLFNRQIMFWGLLWRWGFSWCPGAVDRLLAPSKNRSMFDERFESSILRQ